SYLIRFTCGHAGIARRFHGHSLTSTIPTPPRTNPVSRVAMTPFIRAAAGTWAITRMPGHASPTRHTNIMTRQRYRPGARHGGHRRRVGGRCRPAPQARISSVPDCLFCKIVAGDVPADLVAESGRTIAFRDINPQAPTHILVIPKD